MDKMCKKCNTSKSLESFEKGRATCKICRQIQKTLWEQSFREKNREQYNASQREYYADNKDTIIARINTYQKSNLDKIKKRNKKYYSKNKEKILKSVKLYYELNTDAIKAQKNKRAKINRKLSPSFKIRDNVSRSIRKSLALNKLSKNRKSCLQFLPYTIEELKNHLELQFESWMNWQNQGTYNKNTWNDNDQTTWTWQIDHIVPHSTFNYTSMEDQVFKECWSLSNLRPLSAKQNFLDGITRVRHKEKLNAL